MLHQCKGRAPTPIISRDADLTPQVRLDFVALGLKRLVSASLFSFSHNVFHLYSKARHREGDSVSGQGANRERERKRKRAKTDGDLRPRCGEAESSERGSALTQTRHTHTHTRVRPYIYHGQHIAHICYTGQICRGSRSSSGASCLHSAF